MPPNQHGAMCQIAPEAHKARALTMLRCTSNRRDEHHIAMATNGDIYKGFWINWTDGRYMGSTLTLGSRDGAFLIAFLALYVSISGSHCWQFMCWILFQVRAKRKDGTELSLDEQQLAILRNSQSATSGLVELGRAQWKWSGRAGIRTTLPRSLALAFFAAINVFGFLVAGIFSSRVTSARSDVLRLPTRCGLWPGVPPGYATWEELSFKDPTYHSSWRGQRTQNLAESLYLSQDCYDYQSWTPNTRCNAPGR